MQDIKNIVSIVAVVLVFTGYVPYIRDILKNKTIPHIYSWILWGGVTAIAFALQVTGGAGLASLVTLSAVIMCFVVVVLSFWLHRSRFDITLLDTVFLILGIISLIVWLVAKQPVASAILATTTDLLAFVPTIRKSWKKPYSETLSSNVLNTIRFSLASYALQRYTIVTMLYPLSWAIANGLFAIMLIYRRRIINKK